MPPEDMLTNVNNNTPVLGTHEHDTGSITGDKTHLPSSDNRIHLYSRAIRQHVASKADPISPGTSTRRNLVNFTPNSEAPLPSSEVPPRQYSETLQSPIIPKTDSSSPGPSRKFLENIYIPTNRGTPTPLLSPGTPVYPYSRPVRSQPPTPGSSFLTPPILDPDYEKPPIKPGESPYVRPVRSHQSSPDYQHFYSPLSEPGYEKSPGFGEDDYFSLADSSKGQKRSTRAKLHTSLASTPGSVESLTNVQPQGGRTENLLSDVNSKIEQLRKTQASPSPIYPRNVQIGPKAPRKVDLGSEVLLSEANPATKVERSRKQQSNSKGYGSDSIAKIINSLTRSSSDDSSSTFSPQGSEAVSNKHQARKVAPATDQAGQDGSSSPKDLQETSWGFRAIAALWKASTTLSSSSTTVLRQERSLDLENSAMSSLLVNHEPSVELLKGKQGVTPDLKNALSSSNVGHKNGISGVIAVHPVDNSTVPELIATTNRPGLPSGAATSTEEVQVLPKSSKSAMKSRWRRVFESRGTRGMSTVLLREGKIGHNNIQNKESPRDLIPDNTIMNARSQALAVGSSPTEISSKGPLHNTEVHVEQPISSNLNSKHPKLVLGLHHDPNAVGKDSFEIQNSSRTNQCSIPSNTLTKSLSLDVDTVAPLRELSDSADTVRRNSEPSCHSPRYIKSPPTPNRKSALKRLGTSIMELRGLEADRHGVRVQGRSNSDVSTPRITSQDSEPFLDGSFPLSPYGSPVESQKKKVTFAPPPPPRHRSAIGKSSQIPQPSTQGHRRRQSTSPSPDPPHSLRRTAESRRLLLDDDKRGRISKKRIHRSTSYRAELSSIMQPHNTTMASIPSFLSPVQEGSDSSESQQSLRRIGL